MNNTVLVRQKVKELVDALKAEGLWMTVEPAWVHQFPHKSGDAHHFFEWLQFVYLPNRLFSEAHLGPANAENYITLQVKRYGGGKGMNQNLLRLLVELDAL